jgi:uncharacterized protein (DUF697 family)
MQDSSSRKIIDAIPVTETVPSDVEARAAKRAETAEAARTKAAQLMSERKFTEARIALEEADSLSAEPTEDELKTAERLALAEAARTKAAQLMSERKYAEAKKALEEADDLEAEPAKWKEGPQRLITAIRSRLPKRDAAVDPAVEQAPAEPVEAKPEKTPVEHSMEIVSLYSKIAAVAGVLPGGLLNFAAILAVQVTMVWRIAKVFGHDESKDRIRGTVLSLIGSVIPTGIGHGAAFAIAAIPAALASAVVYFVATPVLAYALTQAVGNAFIMHFESGGTLLTFDPKAFADYFIKEFRSAGGVIPRSAPEAAASPTVAATA